jgi:hypothetical protein
MGTEKSRHQTPLTLKKQGEKNSFSFIEPMLALRVPESRPVGVARMRWLDPIVRGGIDYQVPLCRRDRWVY